MILKLEIENFSSVREKVRLNFRLPKTTPEDTRFNSVSSIPGLRTPSIISIFGANASGKTTILRTLTFIEHFVTRSFEQFAPDTPITINPFYHKDWVNKPTKILIEFIPPSTGIKVEKQIVVRYSVEISHVSMAENFVSRERLSVSLDDKTFSELFDLKRAKMHAKPRISTSSQFHLEDEDPRRNVRNNVSLISSLRQFDHDYASMISKLFDLSFVSNLYFTKLKRNEDWATGFLIENPDELSKLKYRLKTIDVGIEDVTLKEINGKTVVLFTHSGLMTPQPLFFESDGTKSFFHLFPIVSQALAYGSSAVLDELDSDLHPQLVSEIMSWFLRRDENRCGAQLITSCNSASVLAMLEKEEVWIAEKGVDGSTTVAGLAAMKGIRRDANLYARYIGGEFGGIPQFG